MTATTVAGFDLAEHYPWLRTEWIAGDPAAGLPWDHPEVCEARRALTRDDPLLFALIYLAHHLRADEQAPITLSQWHLDLCREAAERWTQPAGFKTDRDAYIAPRDSGKSTWLFLILPMWAAAHGWHDFIAALADSGTQASDHLRTFTLELDDNELLRTDYPALCRPMTRKAGRAREVADNMWTTIRDNGLVFMARGLDSSVLGMKVRNRRPNLIILDDVEPPEEKYTLSQVRKRLNALRDTVLPLNNFARVVLAGTVTMPGSIVHQLVQSVTTTEEPADWIREERFRVHYYPAIAEAPDGTERSIWPEKWPLEVLQEMRHQRSFLKNFQNQPVPEDGDYWGPEDFRLEDPGVFGRTLLSIDPAVTRPVKGQKRKPDYYGFAVVSRGPDNARWKVYVRHASHRRMAPGPLRSYVLRLLEDYPDIGLVLIETNQGGELWGEILHGLPVPVKQITSTEPKHVRAARTLNDYQRGRVFHTERFHALEAEMMAFPNGLHDDLVDATCQGCEYFLGGDRAWAARRGRRVQQGSYVRP